MAHPTLVSGSRIYSSPPSLITANASRQPFKPSQVHKSSRVQVSTSSHLKSSAFQTPAVTARCLHSTINRYCTTRRCQARAVSSKRHLTYQVDHQTSQTRDSTSRTGPIRRLPSQRPTCCASHCKPLKLHHPRNRRLTQPLKPIISTLHLSQNPSFGTPVTIPARSHLSLYHRSNSNGREHL
jgi:hypothetical protein